jgi:hypothetical protein
MEPGTQTEQPAGWPASHPVGRIRAEVDAMAGAWVEVLRSHLPEGGIRTVYLHGSSQKRWESAVDYVPGLSDVDVHLWLRDPDGSSRIDLATALAVNADVRGAYERRVPGALHMPKPQLTFVDRLHRMPGYVPSPRAAVRVVYGEDYPDYRLTDGEREDQRRRDRENLLVHGDWLAALPLRAIDSPGAVAARLVHESAWRVGPVAARVLSLDRMPYEQAWTLNRTRLIAELRARGFGAIADPFEAYYLRGWDMFLEGASGDGTLATLRAGAEAITAAAELAGGG